MLSDSQTQSVASNSNGYQAGRDIHCHGLSLADVLTACNYFLENNFPRLQEEARLKAEEHVRYFAKKFSSDLSQKATQVLIEKFKDPDVQASINDAVNACARKGEAASPDILSRLLVHRMGDNTPFVDLVINEAVTVVPKLSKTQLAFLAGVHFIRSTTLEIPSYAGFENAARRIFPIAELGFSLSRPQKLHLQYAGVISIESLMSGDFYQIFFESFGVQLGLKSLEETKAVMRINCPSYCALLEGLGEGEIFKTMLTSVGHAVAISMLNQVLNLNYSIWLE